MIFLVQEKKIDERKCKRVFLVKKIIFFLLHRKVKMIDKIDAATVYVRGY